MIRVALMNKVGKDALKHYDLVGEDKEVERIASTPAGQRRSDTITPPADEGGLHL